MKSIILKIFKALSKVIKVDEKSIVVIYRGFSGSNLSPIIDKLKSDQYSKYKVNILYDGKNYSDYKEGKISKIELYKEVFKMVLE